MKRHLSRPALLALAAIAITVATHATHAEAAWVSYQKRAEAEELYDNAFVAKEAGRLKLWTLTNFATPLTSLEARDYSSEKSLTTIDCGSRKVGAEQVIRYTGKDGRGDVVGDMQTPLRLTVVRPGSIDEALLDQVCK